MSAAIIVGPIKWNGPSVTIWSILQNPVTYGFERNMHEHIQLIDTLQRHNYSLNVF